MSKMITTLWAVEDGLDGFDACLIAPEGLEMPTWWKPGTLVKIDLEGDHLTIVPVKEVDASKA